MLQLTSYITHLATTPTDILKTYLTKATAENFADIDAGYVILDALWVLALALNDTMSMVNNRDIGQTNCESVSGTLVNLETFNYKNPKMGCIIRWNLNNTNFSGVSVSSYFYHAL